MEMRMRNNMKYENRRGGHGMRTLDKVRNRGEGGGGGGDSGRVKRSNEYSGLVAGKEKIGRTAFSREVNNHWRCKQPSFTFIHLPL